ncbi:type VII secretion protein EccCb [Nocardia sp. BMG111209]|uniref:type VII secretion protein EccCb n=1 Tax=Nocardia sp. BMG111209 TaxID=1160137 RepID=UPI0003A87E5E|nr:type VII secretion protein EccCb [Nocardia sp. BMG111209]
MVGRRIALLVANDTYYSPGIPQLSAPVSDATELQELLRNPEVGAFGPVELLINESKAEIERSAERLFRHAEPEDMVMFYFSGHGIRRGHNLYLAASNTDSDLLSSSAVSSSFVKDLIRESPAATKFIVLDCCYSGAFLGDDVLKGVSALDIVGNELAAGKGICVLMASNSVQAAEDGKRAAPRSTPLSMFTGAMVSGIRMLAAARTSAVTTHDLWQYIAKEVGTRAANQTPEHYCVASEEIHIARARRSPANLADSLAPVPLGGLLGHLEHLPGGGLRAEDWWRTRPLDVPFGRQQEPGGVAGTIATIDFAGPRNGLLLVGRAGSGKSTLLRTLAASLALTHSPADARIHVLESDNRLGSIRGLPSIGSVASVAGSEDGSEQAAAALVEDLIDEIRNRRRLYRLHHIASPTELRHRRPLPDEGPVPDLFLFVDRWGAFARQWPDLVPAVQEIADTGPEYAVHLVATARNWTEVPDWMAESLANRIELRLFRPGDSRIDIDRAALLPEQPGWALTGSETVRIALPGIRPIPSGAVRAADLPDGAEDLVARFASASSSRQPLELELHADFVHLHRLIDPDIRQRWRDAPPSGLRIPIGVTYTGDPVELDIGPATDAGAGPHGLVVGAIGSGKSELLRTIVLGLALTYPPDRVNFLLVDAAGDSTFEPLATLPHVAGRVHDLDQDPSLLDRLQDVVEYEMERRRQLVQSAEGCTTRAEYEQARSAGAPLDPLPALVIVIDEFVELLAGGSPFVGALIQVGRRGRSLGIHLLLGTYQPEEVLLRTLDKYLSYRIVLRTFTDDESRFVLGSPDANYLPSTPGHGYLRTTTGATTRFRSASTARPGITDGADPLDLLLPESLVATVDRLGAPAAYRMWQPPLLISPTVGTLLQEENSPRSANRSHLRLPIGWVDRPREHRREVLTVDLSGDSGHVTVVGGPRSGKSTVLRSLIVAAAATHTPEQVQFYCLDFGGALAALAELPHVGSVAGRRDIERIRRTLAELTALLARRERYFRDLGITSTADFRKRRAARGPAGGAVEADDHGDVFLVVDGLDTLRQDFPALEQSVTHLAAQGISYGIHLLTTMSPWSRGGPGLQNAVRIELWLGDPADSELDRQAAGLVPPDRPGRGLSPEKLQMLTALPRLDSDTDPHHLAAGLAGAVEDLRKDYRSRQAPPIRLLPQRITYEHLLDLARGRGPEQDATHLLLGLGETELSPLLWDFDDRPHLLVFSDPGAGKTTLLRTVALGLAENSTPEQARILLVDYRRTLADVVESARPAAYCPTASTVPRAIAELVDLLTARVPGPEIPPARLPARDWWNGPEIYVLVDDYERVVADGSDPLEPLLKFLPMAHDIGLHLILARAHTGLARARYERVLGLLWDISAGTIVLSAAGDEGALFGDLHTTALPPGRGTLIGRFREPEPIQIADRG